MGSDDLRARIVEALNTTPAGFVQQNPEALEFHQAEVWFRHDRHQYMGSCAMCRGETDTLTDAVMALVQPELAEDAWGSVWLYGNWREITGQMTTPERDLAADAVGRWSLRTAAEDHDLAHSEPEGLRWWREPESAAPAVEDELVRCAGLHCRSRAFFARPEARGWLSAGMGTWLCPRCRPDRARAGRSRPRVCDLGLDDQAALSAFSDGLKKSAAAYEFTCPACGAEPGQPCSDRPRAFRAAHAERKALAQPTTQE